MEKSFTLVETLISIFVFSLLMGAVLGGILTLYRIHSYQWQQGLAISEARRGIEIMVKEIREARQGENGAYPIEYAGDKEFIFYSDIDNDGKVERVRYFLGEILEKNFVGECQTFQNGGSCSVSFSNFFGQNLKEAKVSVSVQGDLGNNSEYVEIFGDNQNLGRLCQTGCTDCPGYWQGTQVFDVTSLAADNSISFLAKASSAVNSCSPRMKARFELKIKEEALTTKLKKGVIKPVAGEYPLDQERVSVITSYVRNFPPIFEYFDETGNKISEYPARLKNTKVMKIFLVVNVDPNRPPEEYQLESYVQLRNLKVE